MIHKKKVLFLINKKLFLKGRFNQKKIKLLLIKSKKLIKIKNLITN